LGISGRISWKPWAENPRKGRGGIRQLAAIGKEHRLLARKERGKEETAFTGGGSECHVENE
jgi:hypothetical protein